MKKHDAEFVCASAIYASMYKDIIIHRMDEIVEGDVDGLNHDLHNCMISSIKEAQRLCADYLEPVNTKFKWHRKWFK